MTTTLTLTINPAVDLSTNVEAIVPVHKLRCDAAKRDAGGGGINVARVMSRLGTNVTALYTRGGYIGAELKQLVEHEGLHSIDVEIQGETRENFTICETVSSNEYRFVFPGPEILQAEWQACLQAIELCRPVPAYIVASGSLSPGVPSDFYARAATIARKLKSQLIVDSSGPALAAALDNGVFLIKPNLRELSDLAGHPLGNDTDRVEQGKRIVAKGQADLVALTMAAQGALLIGRNFALRATAPPIQPCSSVGAGDSFLGGLVFGFASGLPIEDSFRLAVAAGSAALLNRGTELAQPDDIRRLRAQVTLKRI